MSYLINSVVESTFDLQYIGAFSRVEKFQFVGQPLKHYKTGSSAQLVTCGVMVFLFGRSCHFVIDLTGNGTTMTYAIKY